MAPASTGHRLANIAISGGPVQLKRPRSKSDPGPRARNQVHVGQLLPLPNLPFQLPPQMGLGLPQVQHQPVLLPQHVPPQNDQQNQDVVPVQQLPPQNDQQDQDVVPVQQLPPQNDQQDQDVVPVQQLLPQNDQQNQDVVPVQQLPPQNDQQDQDVVPVLQQPPQDDQQNQNLPPQNQPPQNVPVLPLNPQQNPNLPLLNQGGHLPNYGAINQGLPNPQQNQQVPQPQRVTRQNVLDFFTANTPGPITGVSGLSSASSSLLNPPTSNVPSGFANSNFVQKLQPLSRPMTGVGTGASLFTGGMDLLATGLEARQMHQRGWGRFWAGFKASIKKPFGYHQDRSGQEAEDRSASKRLVVNSLQNLGDLGANQVPTAVSSITSLAGGTAAPILGTLASGAGMGINALVALRSAYRGWRAGKHSLALRGLQLQNQEMLAVVEHQKRQMKWRTRRSVLGALGATLGAVGGGLLLGGLLGATMLTPIGWALAAAGGLTAAVLGIHKLHRWRKKRKAGTLHTERERHALALHTAANDVNHAGHQDALSILRARDITPEQVSGNEGLELLKRKNESW